MKAVMFWASIGAVIVGESVVLRDWWRRKHPR